MFLPSNSDVPGGLISKMAYASLLKEGITKKALKYFKQWLWFNSKLSIYSLK